MKPTSTLAIALLSSAGGLLTACGGHSPTARAPESTGEQAAAASSDTGHTNDSRRDAPMKCGGFDIPDLAATLSQAACELPSAKIDEGHRRDVKDVLEITVRPDPARIAPGGESKIQVVFHNKSKTDLPLDFVVDPEPRFDVQVYSLKGARADNPTGPEPAPPSEANEEASSAPAVARVTLAAQGTATLKLDFHAVKYRWAPKERARGALGGRGYPREPAGPLPQGKYVLRVVTPLVGVFEGSDHEVSQPRAPIEVGR